MAYLTLMILLLTVSQSLNSESTDKIEDPLELSWIEKILLFPWCITDCPDLARVPLDDMEETTVTKSTENIPDTTTEEPNLMHFEINVVTTSESAEDVKENTCEMPDLLDNEGSLFTSLVQGVVGWVRTGQNILYEATDTVWQQCVTVASYIRELFVSAADSTCVPEEFLKMWCNVQDQVVDELIAAKETVLETFNKIPCEWALGDHTLWAHLWDTFNTLVGDINWYIFTTLVVLAAALSIQLARRNRGSQKNEDEPIYTNQTGNSRVKQDEGRKTTKTIEPSVKLCEDAITSTTRIDQANAIHKHGLGSPRKQLQTVKTTKAKPHSPVKRSGVHTITKASLEVKDNDAQSPLHALTTSPLPHLVDVGINSIFLRHSPSSDINEATDTSDLRACRENSTSTKPLGSSSMSSPLWIRYGSSPARNISATEDSKLTSPVWIRRISTEDEGVTSFIQKQASPVRPGPVPKRRYVPSPILNEEHFSRSFDVDIGDPCCSSSFIEECLSESEEKVRRDSGDNSLRHSQSFRPSVITKRYTKLKADDFNTSRNSSTDSMLMNVSDMNKSISLYSGDGMVFYELAFFYAFQNIFNRFRELISWSRWARTRRNLL